MTNILETALPLVAAPMAGAGSTPELISAAAAAGAFPFLPAGYKTSERLAADITELKSAGIRFGVNVFKVEPIEIPEHGYLERAGALQPEADRYGLTLADIPLQSDDDDWQAKVAVLLANPVPWVSTTFALPNRHDVAALRNVGTRVAATVTSPLEAIRAQELGVDLLVVQGPRAGGHSGTWEPHRDIWDRSTPELIGVIRRVAATTPIIAGGGVDGRSAVRSILDAGADAAVVGTLLLRSHESGASQTHKDALADPRFTRTVITRAFTGRPARGLLNDFIREHEAGAPLGYPALHHLTSGLRKAAAAAGDPDRVHLWSGTGFRSAQVAPAGQILRELAG